MIAGILQAVEGIAAVGIVLLDQEILSTASQTCFDAGLQGQVTLTQLGKLNGTVKEGGGNARYVQGLRHEGLCHRLL